MAAPHPAVTLLVATVDHLRALQRDRVAFGALIGGDVPDGWPEFGESIGFTIERLTEHPDETGWWTYFFLDQTGTLVGSGGYVGPPQNRTVEIGYEIAPAFRGRRLGVGAAHALVQNALATGDVDTVIAHTLPHENPSTAVLRRLGFEWVGEVPDPEQGSVWRWRLLRAG